jgi:hypothetical protein
MIVFPISKELIAESSKFATAKQWQMPTGGLEPPRLSAHGPKPCVTSIPPGRLFSRGFSKKNIEVERLELSMLRLRLAAT